MNLLADDGGITGKAAPEEAPGEQDHRFGFRLILGFREEAAVGRRDAEQWKDAWQYTSYVFTIESGQPIHPQQVSRLFRQAIAPATVPKIRLHDLRHTAATLARQAGVPIEVISQWLGHSSTAMTFNIYSHVLPEMQDDALARVEAALSGR